MATEIERKFLVKNEHWRSEIASETVMKQAYLANQPNASIRVRIGKGKALLNIKSSTIGIRRSEFEYQIPVEDAEAMLQQVALRPFIEKTRYIIKHGDHTWELDVFAGENQGLVVAEVELESENEPIELPDWVGEEVSGDPRYYNVNLISHPYRSWG